MVVLLLSFYLPFGDSHRYKEKIAQLNAEKPLYRLTTHREVLQFRRQHLRRLLKVCVQMMT